MATPYAYLTLAEFRDLSLMPASDINALESVAPGWIERQLIAESARINSRLAKRYDAPFIAPYSTALQSWLAKIVTWNAWLKRGVNPTDQQTGEYKEQAETAVKEILEAANSETGLFDLPLRSDTDGSGIARSGPLMYSEASPYAWMDVQARDGRTEDQRGGGRGG